jgi:D-tyrosyl-tRNA(Tyr) deacylase
MDGAAGCSNGVLRYRIFEDARPHESLAARHRRRLLLVPQFTLARTPTRARARLQHRGRARAARALFRAAAAGARAPRGRRVGEFGAHMQVSLVNDGPVTFWLKMPPDDKDLTAAGA